jgi:WD40 repeat protein
MVRWTIVLIAFATASAFGVSTHAQEAAAEKTTYIDHVLPLFKARCGSCHNANDRKGGLALDAYATAMEGGFSGTVLEGGDPDASYLWQLVTHQSEPNMPPNSEKLPENELAVIRQWIEGGLLENSGSTAMVKEKSSVAPIEISTDRPAEVAMPSGYLGDPALVAERPNAVTALAVSPWAPIAAVSGYHQISLFNSATLEFLGALPFPEGQPEVLKFSRNGTLLLAGGGHGGASGKVILFDVKTGERVAEVGDEYDAVLAADISPDHAQVALGGPKKMLRVYSVATGELLYENKKHTDWVTAIEFSPDGVLLASADRSNGLVVWEALSGRPFYDLTGHSGAVNDVSWRLDSNVLASGSEDGTIRLWEMNNGAQIKSWNAHGGVAALDFVRDGRIISTGRDRMVRLWNGDGSQIREFGGMTDLGLEVAFDAESECVLGGDWTGIVRVWNAADGALLGQFDTNPPTVAMRREAVQQQLAAATAQAQQSAQAVSVMQQAMAEKQAAAEAAVARSNTAAQAAEQALAANTQATKTLEQKNAAKSTAESQVAAATTTNAMAEQKLAESDAAVKAAEAALKAAQAAYQAALTDRQAAAQALASVSKTAEDAATSAASAQTTANETAAALKAAQEEAARQKAAADAAAQVTPEQQQALQQAQAAAQAAQQTVQALQNQVQQLQALQPAVTETASAQ